MKITVKTDVLKAVALFASTKDVRYYLIGVFIETGPEGARVVATDGHTMAVAKIEGSFPASGIVIPADAIDRIKADKQTPDVTFEYGETRGADPRKVRIAFNISTVEVAEIDGKFPEYRRVFPTQVSGERAVYPPQHHARVQKAATLVGGQSVVAYIAQNGTGAGVAVLPKDIVAVVMPRKDCDLLPECPLWIASSIHPLPEGSFKSSGTGVNTVIVRMEVPK